MILNMKRFRVDLMRVEGGLMCCLFFSGTGPGSGTLDRGRRLYPDWYVLGSQWAQLAVGPAAWPPTCVGDITLRVIITRNS